MNEEGTSRDKQIGRNLQRLRGDMSQQAVADAMREAGFKWSQATVWAVEKGDRPLRVAEAEELAEVIGIGAWRFTGSDTETDLIQLSRRAHEAYQEIKRLTEEFMETRIRIAVTLHTAHETGERLPAPLVDGSGWLDTGPVEAVRYALYKWNVEDTEEDEAADFAHRRGRFAGDQSDGYPDMTVTSNLGWSEDDDG